MDSENNKSLVLNVNDVLNDSQSSVEITKTSKSVNFKVKCYDRNPEVARDKALQIFEELQEKYSGGEKCE